MKKEDLKYGNVIELKNGIKLLYHQHCKDNLLNLNGKGCGELDKFNENLTHCMFQEYDIKRVYEDFTLSKVLWERKENPVLTDDEKVILKNLSKKYEYIARDSNTNLMVYMSKPKKRRRVWLSNEYDALSPFNHLFQFVKWEDKKPYSIEELLYE